MSTLAVFVVMIMFFLPTSAQSWGICITSDTDRTVYANINSSASDSILSRYEYTCSESIKGTVVAKIQKHLTGNKCLQCKYQFKTNKANKDTKYHPYLSVRDKYCYYFYYTNNKTWNKIKVYPTEVNCDQGSPN